MRPEDRERWIEIKRISRDSILGSQPLVAPGWYRHKCYQQQVFLEALVLAFQMEESKQNHMDGGGRIALLREWESAVFAR
jgi:hypothetical protein